jgi:hypothetical protein
VGLTLIPSGSLLDFVAFGMAPQTLLAPLGALSLVWNMMIAPLFNNEKLTRENLVATGIIVLGTLLTVVFAAHSTPTYTLDDLMALYHEPVMMIYLVCVFAFVLSLVRHLRKYHRDVKLPCGLGFVEEKVDAFFGTDREPENMVAGGSWEGDFEDVEGARGEDGMPSTPSKDRRLRQSKVSPEKAGALPMCERASPWSFAHVPLRRPGGGVGGSPPDGPRSGPILPQPGLLLLARSARAPRFCPLLPQPRLLLARSARARRFCPLLPQPRLLLVVRLARPTPRSPNPH